MLCSAFGAALFVSPASAEATSPPPKLPLAKFKSVAKEVLIPMDDGAKIAATVALPSRDGKTALPGRFPVVLGMTPYSRNGLCGCYPPDFWATRGIVGAVADVRGTGGTRTRARSRSSRTASTTTTSRSGRPRTSSSAATGCSCA